MSDSPLPDSGVRQKGLHIIKPIVYGNIEHHSRPDWTLSLGNISKYFGKKREEDGHTHQWTVYLKPYKNEVELSVRGNIYFLICRTCLPTWRRWTSSCTTVIPIPTGPWQNLPTRLLRLAGASLKSSSRSTSRSGMTLNKVTFLTLIVRTRRRDLSLSIIFWNSSKLVNKCPHTKYTVQHYLFLQANLLIITRWWRIRGLSCRSSTTRSFFRFGLGIIFKHMWRHVS